MYISQQALKVLHEDRVNELQKMANDKTGSELIVSGKRVLSNINYLLSNENTVEGYTAPQKAHRTTQDIAAVSSN